MSDLVYQRVFPGISSLDNIWNDSDDKSDKEESISNDSPCIKKIFVL